MKTWTTPLLLLVFCTSIFGATLTVPTQYSTIQGAVNAASNGDTVLVKAGTYYENVDLRAKDILLVTYRNDRATIDGGDNYTTPMPCIRSDGGSPTIDGFVIQGGTGRYFYCATG